MEKIRHCRTCGEDGHQRRTHKQCLHYKPPSVPRNRCLRCLESPPKPVTVRRQRWWWWWWKYLVVVLMITVAIRLATTRYVTSVNSIDIKNVKVPGSSDTYRAQTPQIPHPHSTAIISSPDSSPRKVQPCPYTLFDFFYVFHYTATLFFYNRFTLRLADLTYEIRTRM